MIRVSPRSAECRATAAPRQVPDAIFCKIQAEKALFLIDQHIKRRAKQLAAKSISILFDGNSTNHLRRSILRNRRRILLDRRRFRLVGLIGIGIVSRLFVRCGQIRRGCVIQHFPE